MYHNNTMAQSANISMLACWENQKRKIVITQVDNLDTIQHTICNVLELPQLDSCHQYQIQFYDTEFQKYIDLFPGSWDQFNQLLYTLSAPSPLPKINREWQLQVVTKTIDFARVNTNVYRMYIYIYIYIV